MTTSLEFWNDSIRPVTARFPATTKILDDSNVPFAVSLTPLPTTNKEEEPRFLTQILKCAQCGAPHPNRTTYFQLGSTTTTLILCYLCGRVSSSSSSESSTTLQHDQQHQQQQQQTSSSSSAKGEVFHLPLRLSSAAVSSSSTSASATANLYHVPAMTCPPLWFWVLDGSCHDKLYWHAISRALITAMEQAPSHVHVSLLVAHSVGSKDDDDDDDEDANRKVSIYQLTSSVPYYIQFSSQPDCTRSDELLDAVLQSCVPLSHYRSQIHAALESLTLYPTTTTTTTAAGFPLAWTTQVVLTALEDGAQAAGRHATTTTSTPKSTIPTKPYCGAKLSCFLASRPTEWKKTTSPSSRQQSASSYCQGGRIHGTAPLGARFSETSTPRDDESNNLSSHDIETTVRRQDEQQDRTNGADWTPSALQEYGDWDMVYADLGKQCAAASLGVDLLLCHSLAECDVAVTLLSNSGCPHGPVKIPMQQPNGETMDIVYLTAHVQQIAPWNCVFGAELRVRLSPGFVVDTEPVLPAHPTKQQQPQLSSHYSQGGMIGPVCPVEDSIQLWRMGVCDAHTNLCMDLTLEQASVQQRTLVSGFGQVQLKPVVQTCFAYTTIVRDAGTGDYQTVRRMRISSRRMPLAHRVEELYDSLDPEVLAVVLYHKLVLASMRDGNEDTFTLAEQWLQSLLVCAYQSAEDALEQEKNDTEDATSGYFIAAERLLDLAGDLSSTEVLLGQGHSKLALLPLMVYLLMQCDVFRSLPINLDLRLQALCQMSNMTPTVLARAIAPRLQLWDSATGDTGGKASSNDDEPILDVMELSSITMQEAVMEYSQTSKRSLLLFLDSPDQIIVLNASHVVATGNHQSAELTPALQQAIQDAADSYRVPPPIYYELAPPGKGTSPVLLRLIDVLMEDAPSSSGDEHFAAWRSRIATLVDSELSTGL